ncbi:MULTISPECIES: DUF4157 domain-containing protein [unclassified Streptomyces]|uniref:eCIS core domain-containing protein n=1 Tax=unclassified Streptomyces TaxID=2593676 RepID=UPI0037F8127F
MVHDYRSAQSTGKKSEAPKVSTPPRQTGLLALQRAAGNAAVLRLLQLAEHPYSRHQHSAGCEHLTADAAEAQVQRSAVHDVLGTSGKPLDSPVREEMEARLGSDFSNVRIHDDSAAKASAAEVGARAYTSGHHIVIGDRGGDRHTLAHELTHVIQQRQGPVAGTDQGNGVKVSDPSDRFEQAAEANAHKVLAGPTPVQPDVQRAADPHRTEGAAPAPAVQRMERDEEVQSVLTSKHWADKAVGAGKSVAPSQADKKRKFKKGAPRRLDHIIQDVGPKLLKDLAETKETGKLKLYRTMDSEEAEAIIQWKGKKESTENWLVDSAEAKDSVGFHAAEKTGDVGILPTKNHLGDYEQAAEYYKKPDSQVMVEFTLKEGAHQRLFDPDHMAVAGASGTPYHMRSHFESENGGKRSFQEGSGAEGGLPGYVGVKQEKKGPFSLSLGDNDATRLLFQLFVEDVRKV